MAPIQVLTNNLLYDFSQTAIPTDNVDEEYIATPRRWDISNIFKFMMFIGPISSIFDYATYAVMLFVFDAWNNAALFQTGWFVESLLTQTLIIHIIRTARIPFIESHASPALIGTTIIILHCGNCAAVQLGRQCARLYSAAPTLLAAPCRNARGLRDADAPDQNMVRAPLGDVRKTVDQKNLKQSQHHSLAFDLCQ
jgi:hypothetical protein